MVEGFYPITRTAKTPSIWPLHAEIGAKFS